VALCRRSASTEGNRIESVVRTNIHTGSRAGHFCIGKRIRVTTGTSTCSVVMDPAGRYMLQKIVY
jgi:hypothetical protein